jgi:hypothetical protein
MILGLARTGKAGTIAKGAKLDDFLHEEVRLFKVRRIL